MRKVIAIVVLAAGCYGEERIAHCCLPVDAGADAGCEGARVIAYRERAVVGEADDESVCGSYGLEPERGR